MEWTGALERRAGIERGRKEASSLHWLTFQSEKRERGREE
jgi:hypothetical protein